MCAVFCLAIRWRCRFDLNFRMKLILIMSKKTFLGLNIVTLVSVGTRK